MLVLALCLVAALSVRIGAYEPMLVEGRVWELSDGTVDGEGTTYTVSFDGGKRQAHNCEYFVNTVSPLDKCSSRYQYMTEEDGVVYFVRFEDGIAYRDTLLDFRYKDGDKIYFPGFNFVREQSLNSSRDFYHVVTEDSIKVNDRKYRRIYMKPSDSGLSFYWVEGIGGNFIDDVLYKYITMEEAWFMPDETLRFVAVYENGERIFSYSDFYGTSVVGLQQLEADTMTLQSGDELIYDLQGRRLDAISRPGVYIVNGVKTLVR
ncbi:MAG: hypothetical protein K2G94_05960 [Muribaculaceae bacterium]|nr:hypothetical protein [Muribaculaceae bacterium]